MADYNLGRAQGEISMKYDGSGIKDAGKDLGTFEKDTAQVASKLDKAQASMAAAGGKMTKSLTLPLVAMGGVALKASLDVNDAYNNIRFGTGATGEDLESLKKSFDEVVSKTPADMGQVSAAVADLNTRLGLTGPTLETLARQVLEVGRMGGVETDINKVSGAFSAFHIEGDATVDAMDDIFRVSQATGVGINELADRMSRSGAVLSQLGFGFVESASLIGVLDKAGVDANAVIASMQKSLVTLARSGEEPIEAFNRITGELQKLIDSGKDAEALDLAATVFGTRGAGQFVAALKSGKVNLEDMAAAAGMTGDTILGVADETKQFPEQFKELKNQAMLALSSIGQELLPMVSTAIKKVVPMVTNLVKWFSNLSPTMKTIAVSILGIVAAAGPLLSIGAKIITLVRGIGAAMSFLAANPIVLIIGAIVALVAGFIYLWNTSEDFRNFFIGIWETIKTAVGAIIDFLVGFLQDAWETIKSVAEVAWNLIKKIIIDPITAVVEFVTGAIDRLVEFLSSAWDLAKSVAEVAWNLIKKIIIDPITATVEAITTAIDSVVKFLSGAWEKIKSAASTAWNFVKSAIVDPLSAAWNWIQSTFNKVVGFFKGIWDGVVSTTKSILGGVAGAVKGAFDKVVSWIKAPINSVIDGINWVIRQLNKLSFTVPSWVPVVGGSHFGFNIGEIPHLAGGGVVSRPTVAVVGDAGPGNPEIVAPEKMLRDIMSEVGGGVTVQVAELHVREEGDIRRIAQELYKLSVRDRRRVA